MQETGFFCTGRCPSEIARISALVAGMRDEKIRLFTPKPDLYEEFRSDACSIERVEGDLPSKVLEWSARPEATLLIVDGSLRIVAPATDAGCPVLLIRPHGRWDRKEHLEAFDRADSLIAPFTKMMEQAETPIWICEKTLYCGGLLRIERLFAKPSSKESVILKAIHEGRIEGRRYVTVALHRGDAVADISEMLDGVMTNEKWSWLILGDNANDHSSEEEVAVPENVTIVRDVTAPLSFYRLSDVVIGTADQMTVLEVALSGARFICIPQDARHDEQRVRGEVLRILDIATVLDRWPIPLEWDKWLRHVSDRPARMHAILEDGGARRATAHIRSRIAELRSSQTGTV